VTEIVTRKAGEVEAPRRKRRLGIATQVFIGLGLGIVVGVFFGEEAAFLNSPLTKSGFSNPSA
jgi:Na+/H+-dicarboxylate symporter